MQPKSPLENGRDGTRSLSKKDDLNLRKGSAVTAVKEFIEIPPSSQAG